jgi:hypothetical protein
MCSSTLRLFLFLAASAVAICQTFNKSEVLFVVSRFRESLESLCILKDYNHVVYNRGEASTLKQCGFHVKERTENVGRESYVYLSHIIDHYDHLPPAIVFLQGDVKELRKDLAVLFDTGQVTLPPKSDGFAFLYSKCTSSRKASHIAELTKRYGPAVKDLLLNGHEKLLDVSIANPRYSGFGYFIVTRDAILRRPKSFYLKLARLIGDRNDPFEGHFFERAWAEVFLSQCAMDTARYYCSLIPKIVCK